MTFKEWWDIYAIIEDGERAEAQRKIAEKAFEAGHKQGSLEREIAEAFLSCAEKQNETK
jgi:hypothetical protein